MAIHVDPPRRPRFREKDETTSYLDGLWSWLYQLAEKLNAQQDAPAPVTQVVNNYGGRGGGGGSAKLEPTGSSTRPIYIDAEGKATAISHSILGDVPPVTIKYCQVLIANTGVNSHHFDVPGVTDRMAVLSCKFTAAGASAGEVSITTGNGTIDISGTFNAQTWVVMLLGVEG